jgi:hypothetical protein
MPPRVLVDPGIHDTVDSLGPTGAEQVPLLRDPLLHDVTHRLLDRLLDCKARDFPNVLILGGACELPELQLSVDCN